MARRDRASAVGRDGVAVPASFAGVLGEFRSCFSAWTFPVFLALSCGLICERSRRTVCAMLVGARLSATWSHHRAHRFFSHSKWSVDQMSGVAARLVVKLLVPAAQAVLVVIDDTLFKRSGPKVFAASWFHDGSAKTDRQIGYGNNWVIAAIVVRLPILKRPLALPVAFSLVEKGTEKKSRLVAARRLVVMLSEALEGRRIDVVADAAYAGKVLRGLPETVTWTTRLRSNAALYQLAPPRTGKRGRPRLRGDGLGSLAQLAKKATFTPTSVERYGKEATVGIAVIECLWYGVFGPQKVRVILVRDTSSTGYDIALASTDLDATPAALVERYAARWSIETAIEDAKQLGGVGEARNRLQKAVERTVPFALLVNTLAIVWYATVGYHPDDVDERRHLAPWYRDKAQPSVLDMLAKLRSVIIAGHFRQGAPQPLSAQEIATLRLAWEDAAA